MTVCNYIGLPSSYFFLDWLLTNVTMSLVVITLLIMALSCHTGTEQSTATVLCFLRSCCCFWEDAFFLDVTIFGKQFWDFLLLLILNIQIGPVNKHHHHHALYCGSIADVVWRIKVYCVNTMRHVVLNNFTEIKLCRFSLKGAIHTQINSLIIYSPFCW